MYGKKLINVRRILCYWCQKAINKDNQRKVFTAVEDIIEDASMDLSITHMNEQSLSEFDTENLITVIVS